jgi:quercetin dioxygenase-like cupin family protein
MTKLDEKHEAGSAEPEVRTVTDLVAYQGGSVVSRTVAKTPGGSVTLFAFDAGQGLSEHTAAFDALVQVIDGQAEITISGLPYPLGAGQMIVMPANRPHALRALTPFKMVLTMLKA